MWFHRLEDRRIERSRFSLHSQCRPRFPQTDKGTDSPSRQGLERVVLHPALIMTQASTEVTDGTIGVVITAAERGVEMTEEAVMAAVLTEVAIMTKVIGKQTPEEGIKGVPKEGEMAMTIRMTRITTSSTKTMSSRKKMKRRRKKGSFLRNRLLLLTIEGEDLQTHREARQTDRRTEMTGIGTVTDRGAILIQEETFSMICWKTR